MSSIQNKIDCDQIGSIVNVNAIDHGDASEVGSLKYVCDLLGLESKTIALGKGIYSVGTSFTIPSNVAIRMNNGAILQIATGKTLTINGPFEAGLYQVFDCVGTSKVMFGNIKEAYTEWWYSTGTYTNALYSSLLAWKIISFVSEKTYEIADRIQLFDGCVINGQNATIINSIPTAVPLFHIKGSNVTIKDISIINTDVNIGGNTFIGEEYVGGMNIEVGSSINTTGYSNILLQNINISGGDTPQQSSGAYLGMILAWGLVSNVSAENIIINGAYAVGLGVEWNMIPPYMPKNINIRNIIIDGAVKGLWLSANSGTSVVGAEIKNCDMGAYIYIGDRGEEANYHCQVSISNSKFINNTTFGVGVVGYSLAEPTIIQKTLVILENNYIYGGIYGVQITKPYGVRILGGLIEGTTYGVYLDSCSNGIIIDGCIFNTIIKNAIWANGVCGAIIMNNKFLDVYTDGGSIFNNNAIFLSSSIPCELNTITHNIFGYQGQITPPHCWIYLCKTVNYMPQNNIITGNIFFASASEMHIINVGTSNGMDSYLVKNYIWGNIHPKKVQFHIYGSYPYQYYRGVDHVYGPITSAPTVGNWNLGDEIHNTSAYVGLSRGMVCSNPGTFSSAIDNTGSTDGSTGLIIGMTDTSDFNIGEYVTVSNGFPSTQTHYKILNLTSTTMTLSANSNSAQNNVTVQTADPVFTNLPNL